MIRSLTRNKEGRSRESVGSSAAAVNRVIRSEAERGGRLSFSSQKSLDSYGEQTDPDFVKMTGQKEKT